MGPQVGYYVPQILMEEDLHGPGIDARGASFPGVNLYVQLGHGRDYAWSATTAYADNVDTFAEVLCQDDVHYLWKGQCRAMDRLDRTNSWTPNASDSTPPGSETLTAYRTVHGIVTARGTVRGKKVAFVQQRSTYFHEADSALGFKELNDPGFVQDPESFRRAIGDINFGFNWAYVDSEHIAYQNSGWYPNRAKGVSTDFPILGTGQYDWQSFDPATGNSSRLTNDQHPHVVDQDYLVSWNNDQAPGFSAADDNWSFGSVQRAQLIDTFVRRGLRGGKKLTLNGLVQAMEEPATQDIRGGARAADAAEGDRPAARQGVARRARAAGELGPPRRAPARPQRRRQVRRRRGGHADGRLVAEGGQRGLRQVAEGPGVPRDHDDDRRGRPHRRRQARRAGVLLRLVELRAQGPAHAVQQARPARALLARALRRRLEERVPPGAAGLAARRAEGRPRPALPEGRLRQRPAGVVLRPQPLDRRVGDRRAARAVPEPPDVPADGGAHA